ncbi:MAG: hypothetical protein ABI333_22250 [bacterium]
MTDVGAAPQDASGEPGSALAYLRLKLRFWAGIGAACAALSMLCFFGVWHQAEVRRIIGSPIGDCVGQPCMAVTKEAVKCTGRSHFPDVPWPMLPGALAILAQLGIALTARRRAILWMTIGVGVVSSVGLLFPLGASIDHLGDKTTELPAGVFYALTMLGLLGVSVVQLVLSRRLPIPIPPRPAA